MKKYVKKHLKDEKRILKLMYKKNTFELLDIDLNDLSWEYFLQGKRQRKRRGNNHTFIEYLPELHVLTQNYWGEGDSYSVVEHLKDHIYFTETNDYDEDGFPLYKKYPKTNDVINFLLKQPTKKNDNKFNSVLKRTTEY